MPQMQYEKDLLVINGFKKETNWIARLREETSGGKHEWQMQFSEAIYRSPSNL